MCTGRAWAPRCQVLYPKVGVLPFCFPRNSTEEPQEVGREILLSFHKTLACPVPPHCTPPTPPNHANIPPDRGLPQRPFPHLDLNAHLKGSQVAPLSEEKVGKQVSVGHTGVKTSISWGVLERGGVLISTIIQPQLLPQASLKRSPRQAWWYSLVIPAVWRLRQEGGCETSLLQTKTMPLQTNKHTHTDLSCGPGKWLS